MRLLYWYDNGFCAVLIVGDSTTQPRLCKSCVNSRIGAVRGSGELRTRLLTGNVADISRTNKSSGMPLSPPISIHAGRAVTAL